MKLRIAGLAWILGGAPLLLHAQDTPVIPEKVWQALANELSGDIAFDHLRQLTLYHTPNAGAEGFRLSAQWLSGKAREAGLSEVKLLSLKAPTRGWTIRGGEAWIVSPFERKLGDVRETPLRAATNSRSGDVTAELVDVGAGLSEADYAGKKVRGKIVLASGEPAPAHEQAVKRGALGLVSYGGRRAYPDQLPWRGLPERDSTFAWMLTAREGERLRAEIASVKAGPIRARVKIEAEFADSNEGILEGWIRGSEVQDQAVILVAHLQEERTSANDNRSGCASLLEIARSLSRLIAEGKLNRPRRDIRFWWVDEIRAPYQYFAENPEAAKKILIGFNQDMVGAKLSLGPRTVVMSLTPFSRASFLNDVAESVLEAVRAGNTPFPFSRDNTDEGDFSRPIFSTLGTREPFRAMAVPFYGGTDHLVFNDGRVGIPMVSLDNWPDPFIHSTDDDLWQIDATQLRRNAFIVAATAYFIASAGEPEAVRLSALLQAGAQRRLSRNSAAAILRLADETAGSPADRYRDATLLLEVVSARELAAIDSARALMGEGGSGQTQLAGVRQRVEALGGMLRSDLEQFYRASHGTLPRLEPTPQEKAAGERVPEWAVPLAESLKLTQAARVEGLHPFYVMEVRNLIDGRRSTFDIYCTVRAASLSAGEWYYGSVSLPKVNEVLEKAEEAGAIRFRGR